MSDLDNNAKDPLGCGGFFVVLVIVAFAFSYLRSCVGF